MRLCKRKTSHYTSVIDSLHAAVAPFVNALAGTPLARATYALYVCVVVWPLQQVYLRGWWRNMPAADICAHLTAHRSAFWSEQSLACVEIIHNNFDSWLVYAQFALYLVIWMFAVRWLLRRLCG